MMLCDTESTAGNCASVNSTTAIATGTWVHLTGVYDRAAGQAKLYVNGTLETTLAVTPKVARGPFTIGKLTWDGSPNVDEWYGGVDDVQVYSKALSASEVSQVYGGTVPAATAKVSRTSYTLDSSGAATSETDPNGNVTYITNDEVGRAVVTTSPTVSTVVGEQNPVTAVAVTRLGFNTFGEATEQQDANGNVATMRYDGVGRPTETQLPSYTAPGSSTPIVAKSVNVYNSAGQITTARDPLGNETSYVYDQLGRLAKTTAPDGGESKYAYNLNGDVLSYTDPTGAKTTSTFDYLGRTLTSTQVVRQASASYTTTIEYGTGPWPTRTISPTGVVNSFGYNALGERTSTKDGANNATTTVFDGAGRPIKVTAPDGTYTTATYDLAGQATAARAYNSTGAQLRSLSTVYDVAGQALSTTDAAGTTKTFSYDVMGQLVSQTEPISGSDSIVTSFGYDLAGNQTRFVDGRGNRFVTTYNSWGLPESQIEPATTAFPALTERTFTIAYDAAGRPTRTDSPGGVSVATTYDVMGRLLSSSGTGAEATTANRTFAYDLAGRVTSFTGSAGSTSVTYDDRSLPTAITGVSGASSYAYNSDGAMTSRVDAAGTTTYGYDGAGRLSTVGNTAAGLNLTYAYNTMSQVTSITHGTGGNVRSFTYDALQRQLTDELKTSGGTSIAKIAYGYDTNDNITSKVTTGFNGASSNTYTYDLADRLVGWNNGTTPVVYAYDKSGNRVQAGTVTFAYDARNQLTSSSDGTTYQYTARGTLRRTIKASQTYDTLADAFGQVVSQAAAGTTATYTYDGLGRLIQPNLTYTGLANTVAGDGTAGYVRDPGDALIGVAAGGSSKYAWTDLHTDAVGEFTATGTTLTGSVSYDPWGKILASGGMVGKLGYQSEWTDQGTGRVNMWNRWYNPETGAFDTRDTANNPASPESGAANRFAYAEADPIANTDTTGNAVDGGGGGGGCGSDDYNCQVRQYERDLAQYERDMEQHDRDVQATGGEIAAQEADYNRASQESNTDLWSILLQVGIDMLLDMIGYTSAVACFGSGDLGACVDLALNVIPWTKVFKFIKPLWNAVHRGFQAFKMWRNIVDTARKVMQRAADLLNAARKHLTDLMHKLPKKPKVPKKKPKPKAPPKPKPAPKPKPKPKPSKPAKPEKPRTTPKKQERPENTRPKDKDKPKDRDNNDPRRERDPDAPGCHSFDPATRVLMADGSTRPISDVNVGDKVATTDPVSGQHGDRQVTMLHLNRDTELADVTVSAKPADDAGSPSGEGKGDRTTRGPTRAVLHTTAHHPFWDATAGEWVDAAKLVPGKSTLVDPNGQVQYVTGVHNFTGAKIMRDLTVDTIHTYYVLAGDRPVLVHNCGSEAGAQELLERAKQLRLYQGTTAVVRVRSKVASADGSFAEQVWIATSKRYMPGRWKLPNVLKPGEVFKPRIRPGNTHAEEDIMDHLGDTWEIIEGASNVNICKGRCLPGLLKLVTVGGRSFRTTKPSLHSPWRLFWRECGDG
jgi:RHS repeat-associated protein